MEAKNKTVRYLLNIWTFFLIAFFSTLAQASNYYVDGSNGNDSNSGTISSPWKTISKANNTLKTGDTVYIRSGTYFSDQINPKNSGKSGNYITYQNYNGELVTITGAGRGAELSGKNFIKIDGLSFYKTTSYWIYLQDADHNIIQNCMFKHAKTYAGLIIKIDSDYNRILNNTFETSPASGDANGTFPADHMMIGYDKVRTSSYNLVQGNTFNRTGHGSLVLYGPYNVVRGNIFQNKYHTGLGLGCGSQLVEENRFYDQGVDYKNDPIPATDRLSNPGIQLSWSNHIIRKNIFDNNGSSMVIYSTKTKDAPTDCRFFNNTMNKAVRVLYGAADNSDGFSNNVLKNNAITNAFDGGRGKRRDVPALVYYYYKQGSNHKWYNNNVYGPTDANRYSQNDPYPITFAYMLSNYSSDWVSGNIASDPKYNDSDSRDFTLQSSSPMLDAGTWLTTITNFQGSSPVTTFVVDDAKYFYDGWGIPGERGDQIKTESGHTATIASVNYSTNTITVSLATPVVVGEGVALVYYGDAPDIGAHEYGAPIEKPTNGPGDGSLTKPLPPPSTSTLNAKFQKATLNSGNEYYTDRTYTLTSMPSEYVDMDLIKTPNDERNLTTEKNYLTFEPSRDVTVYVAFDSRATSLPGWMSGFSNTGDRIYTSLSSQPYLKVYSRSYSAGDFVNLGASKATGFSGNTVSNYIVFYAIPAPVGFKIVEHQN